MLDMELAVVPICKGGTKSFKYDVVYTYAYFNFARVTSSGG